MNKLMRLTQMLLIILSLGIITAVSVDAILIHNPAFDSAGADQTEDENHLITIDTTVKFGIDHGALNFLLIQVDETPATFTDAPMLIPAAPWVPVSGDAIRFEIPVSDRFGSRTDTESTPVLLFYNE